MLASMCIWTQTDGTKEDALYRHMASREGFWFSIRARRLLRLYLLPSETFTCFYLRLHELTSHAWMKPHQGHASPTKPSARLTNAATIHAKTAVLIAIPRQEALLVRITKIPLSTRVTAKASGEMTSISIPSPFIDMASQVSINSQFSVLSFQCAYVCQYRFWRLISNSETCENKIIVTHVNIYILWKMKIETGPLRIDTFL